MDVFTTDWRQAVTSTPIDNATEGGTILVSLSVEGGQPLEMRVASGTTASGFWAVPRIAIFTGNEYGRFCDMAVEGLPSQHSLQYSAVRTYGFERQIALGAGERFVCVAFWAVSNITPIKILRRMPTVTVSVVQLYK